jgi:hypothetical protein
MLSRSLVSVQGSRARVLRRYVAPGVLTIVTCLLCTECAPSQAEGLHTVPAVLLDYASGHCSIESITEQAGRAPEADLIRATAWLHRSLLRSPDVRIISAWSNATVSTGALSYRELGHDFRLTWYELHPPEASVRRHLRIRACLLIPRRIDVIDTDMTRDHLRVLYTMVQGYSWIGRQLEARKLLTGNNVVLHVGSFEQLAILKRRPPPQGWTIEAVGLNS